MRLNGNRPKAEFYLAERVLTDTEIQNIMVSVLTMFLKILKLIMDEINHQVIKY
jgi:hypothetical protein